MVGLIVMPHPHCWMDRGSFFEEKFGFLSEEHIQAAFIDPSASCMLEHAHEGDHEWTDDALIDVSFPPLPLQK